MKSSCELASVFAIHEQKLNLRDLRNIMQAFPLNAAMLGKSIAGNAMKAVDCNKSILAIICSVFDAYSAVLFLQEAG